MSARVEKNDRKKMTTRRTATMTVSR